MKANIKILIFAALTLSSIAQVHSQGYIVANGVTAGQSGNAFVLNVIQNPSNGDYTGFTLIPQGANTFLFGPALDEGVRVFLVSSNQPISLSPILTQNYTELLYPPPSSYTFSSGSPFYVGLYTGLDPFDEQHNYTGIYTEPVFGWAQLVNNNGVISMLGSALEYGGGGIYAGTQTIIPIPEPSTIALTVIGTFFIGLCRWRRISKD